jgi:hypothetical protein
MKKNSPRWRRGLEQELSLKSNEAFFYPVPANAAIAAPSIEGRQ